MADVSFDNEVVLEDPTENKPLPKRVKREESFMVAWLLQKKIAKTKVQAQLLLLAASLLALSASLVMFYFSSLYSQQYNLDNQQPLTPSNVTK